VKPRKSAKKNYDPVLIELGSGLVPLLGKDNGRVLSEQIGIMREDLFADLELVVPRVRIVDNSSLKFGEYRIKVNGAEIHREILGRKKTKLVPVEESDRAVLWAAEVVIFHLRTFYYREYLMKSRERLGI
jgi:flagellar biosynthesis component FlhA